MLPSKWYSISVIVCLIFVCREVDPSHVGQEESGEHFKKIGSTNGGEALNAAQHKAEKVHENESAITDNRNSQISDSKDLGNYVNKDVNEKGHDESSSFGGKNYKNNNEEDSHHDNFRKGHKKGHNKQGFTNSYHKDESSNKSTFFDDFNDEGDIARTNSHKNQLGRQDDNNYQGATRGGSEHLKKGYTEGGYNRQGDLNKRRSNHNDYGRKYYNDDSRDYNRHNKGYNSANEGRQYNHNTYYPSYGGGHYGGGGNYGGGGHHYNSPSYGYDQGYGGFNQGSQGSSGFNQGQHGFNNGGYDQGYGGYGHNQGHGGYDDFGYNSHGGIGDGQYGGYDGGRRYGRDYLEDSGALPVLNENYNKKSPVIAHRTQTITIYEDPRYDESKNGAAAKGDAGSVELDVRPSNQRYASSDTYYQPRKDGGVERRSNINRLVFNYSRQK